MITDYFNKTQTVLNELEPDILILDNLIGSTEEEFLVIGEKLQKFYQQAGEISALSSDVASQISGDEMKPVVEVLNSVSEMVEKIGSSFDAEKKMLSSILTNMARIRAPLINFENIARNLNVLCAFIKIETARLGDTGTAFHTLSDDVRRLASLVSTKTGNLIDKTDTLIPALNENISLIDNYKFQQEGQSRVILDKISNNLAMISQRKDLSAATVVDISAKWRQATVSIGEIVQSMQFHDITRQRIEHTCDALKNLKQKAAALQRERTAWRRIHNLFKNSGQKNDNCGSAEYPVANLIADTCNLQCAQLQKAKDDFAKAIEHILENMKNVAFYAGSISDEIMHISGKKEGNEGSFIREMEEDVDYLINSIGIFAQIKKDLSEAMNTMTSTAAGMSGYMQEMEKISIEMQTLALNASIHAAHIGDQGTTLSTLADSIHRLAAETATMVMEIIANLKEAIANAEKLAVTANAEISEGHQQTAQIKNSLGQMLLPLKTIDAEIAALLPQIDKSGRSLAADIQDLISEVQIQDKIGSGIERVETSLVKAIQKINVKKDENTSGNKAILLEDLASQYTMDCERETHLAIAGITPELVSPEPDSMKSEENESSETKPPVGNDDDLGDNVELF